MILPCKECGGQCCTYPVFSESELSLVRLSRGIPPGAFVTPISHVQSYDSRENGTPALLVHLANGTCPYLSDGKCSIYEMRPKVCREYGVNAELPCAYLYPDKAKDKLATRIDRLKRAT